MQRTSRRFTAFFAAAIVLPVVVMLSLMTPALSASGDRTLYLYYTHTKETAKITFRRGGRYDQKGLAELNRFLRDWRRNEPTKMDPALFDLVWEVYQQSGATGPIHVVSAYRAPATNEMLRSNSSGVAKNSRHTMGMAMDFFIPGVGISKLREIAMKKQVGGVGYYPTSGSPFVHLDTGNVRAWPRMTKAQLQKLFPDGKTLHLPTDGTPLSQKGYQLAKAEWTKCHAIPCNGRSSGSTRVASNDDDSKSGKTLFDYFFGSEEDEGGEESVAVTQVATTTVSAPVVPKSAPVPHTRPDFGAATLVATAEVPAIDAPIPAARPDNLFPDEATMAVAAIEESMVPQPRALLSNDLREAESAVTAYVDPNTDGAPTDSQPASTATYEVASGEIRTLLDTELRVASMTPASTSDISSLIQGGAPTVGNTKTSVMNLPPQTPPPAPAMRQAELVAPDLEHVIDILADPQLVSSNRYGVFFEHDQADLNPATELGALTHQTQFTPYGEGLNATGFVDEAPLVLASR